tara:strand:+ start:1732 stop:1914 length:183 start_codon:yes stop_codon:yes gene_type:complete
MIKNEKYINDLILAELGGNLKVLIDPKKKNSFSDGRVQVWKQLVADRICHHLLNKNNTIY